VQSWTTALKRGERLPRQAKYRYGAAIVQEKLGKRVQVPALSVPLTDGELDRLAEVTVKLDRLVKQLKPQLLVLAQQRLNAVSENGDEGDEYEAAGLGELAELLNQLNRGSDGAQNWEDMEEKERTFPPVDDLLAQIQDTNDTSDE
jgi:hypothetical protein